MIKRFLFLFSIALGITSCGPESSTSDNQSSSGQAVVESEVAVIVQSIEGKEAMDIMKDSKGLIILDVRTQKEYDAGHIKDALHIDFHSPKFSQHLLALDPDKTYMVYCEVGGRSKKAVGMMKEMGFKQLYEVSDGYPGLMNAGVPVVGNQD